MIDRTIAFAARNPLVVLALVAALAAAGWWAMGQIALDAIPDLSDTQVIVYSRWDRSPDIIEDQVTYPIVTAMLGAPRVQDVRGISDFGYSYDGLSTPHLSSSSGPTNGRPHRAANGEGFAFARFPFS